jgi:ABC-type transport system substrate-binding protein
MRRLFLCASLWTLLLASCSGPAPVPVIESTATPAPVVSVPSVPGHAEALRFALVGQPTQVNAWALFDEIGASYANYAIRSDEVPRLYRLSVPAREFESYIADGMPSIVTQEGAFHVASVQLKTGLTWSDGSPLTAQDVAFTVNTALAFHLGLDWLSAYNPDRLYRAEAVDETTVKFIFKTPFNVGDWQYGALQGPILSRAYWSPKMAEASSLLPSLDMPAAMEKVKSEADTLQARINADNVQLATSVPNSPTANELNLRIARNQEDLNAFNSQYAKLQEEYNAALSAARAALYALTDDAEPTFGPFLRATKSRDMFTREADPSYPFAKPNYDRAVYTVFADINSAYQAYSQTDLDVVLSPYGGFQESSAPSYPTSSARFLVFNPKQALLMDPILHRAISCVLSTAAMVSGQEWVNDGFVLPGSWLKNEPHSVCSELSTGEKIQKSVSILKDAGYSWAQEPTAKQAGKDLILPNGKPFPPVTLLTTSPDYDLWRANAGIYIEKQAQYLGIPLTRQETTLETIRYSVYSSGEYDMAILGWNLSEYPGYLCDWLQEPSPFAYNGDRPALSGAEGLRSACEALNATADLATARQSAFDIQSILMEDLPFIPLYEILRYDSYRNVTYPFGNVLNGISGLYGAPALAIPSQ